jgi:hypothetical protein
MKKLVILLIAIALGVMFLWSPLAARDRDPTTPMPWMESGAKPNGDGGAWNEADSEGGYEIVVIFDLFKFYASRFLIINIIPSKIDNSGSIERDVPSNNADIPTSRDASSR